VTPAQKGEVELGEKKNGGKKIKKNRKYRGSSGRGDVLGT